MTTILTLQDRAQGEAFYASGVWQHETLYARLRYHAQVRPNAYALRDRAQRLTWKAFLQWTDTVAAELELAGLRRGSRVSIWLPNRVEALVVFLACSRNGYICNPSLHQNYTVAETALLLERIQCEAFFGQAGYGADAALGNAPAKISAVSTIRHVCWLAPRDSDFVCQFPLPGSRMPLTQAVDDPDKIVYLAFTSGTTGPPKAVMHSDNTLLANGRAMQRDWGHDAHTVLMAISPLSHHIGTVALEQTLVAGCELVVNDVSAGQRTIDCIMASGATYVMGVPTHAMDILAEMKQRGMDRLGSVNVFYMAGAPIPRETAQALLSRGIVPQNVYGMTENGSHQYTLPNDAPETIVATCGRACDAYEVRLWDQENANLPAATGQIGEIGGRGGCLMLGYFGNQQATENSFNDSGWFLSGDLGRFDNDGNLTIVGRKKDLIIRGGHNIHPAEIEGLAMTHAVVAKAAAFPVADDRLGERVCLAIIAGVGDAPSGEQMLRHLFEAGLSKYDMPEYYLVLDAFPLTASGKIFKRGLVEQVSQGQLTPLAVRWKATLPINTEG